MKKLVPDFTRLLHQILNGSELRLITKGSHRAALEAEFLVLLNQGRTSESDVAALTERKHENSQKRDSMQRSFTRCEPSLFVEPTKSSY
jgi:hypothetical protein